MAQTPDNDAWLEQIRCPQYFDFEAALTVPCPNGGDTNPPLRDSVYESDDETRDFFRTLRTDNSLHHTPHPQENSPPRADLRNLRSIHRHRPTTSFAEYLQQYKDSQDAKPKRDSGSSIPEATSSFHHTPTRPERKASLTPKRHPRGKLSQTPTKTIMTSNTDLKTPTLDSIPTPKSSKRNPSTPCRLPFQTSAEGTRKSAPNELVPVRRRRPPERVTPPLNSVSSKSTSGGFGRAKSRKAIAWLDNTDGRQGHLSRLEQSAAHSENTSPKKSFEKSFEKPASEEEGKICNERNETKLLDVDPDILRMMEEHNRRIQWKQAQTEGKDESGKVDSGITLRNTATPAPERDALPWNENTGNRNMHVQQRVLSSKGKATSESKDQRSAEQRGNESGSGVEASRQVRLTYTRRRIPSSLQRTKNLRSDNPNDENTGEDAALDELLKSENDRVLQERKKRLPERRKAFQVDKTVALKYLEGQRADQDRQRIPAKVEFTSANENAQAGTPRSFKTNGQIESNSRGRGKENSTTERPLPLKSRKRGFKGFREKSRMGSSQPVSSSLSMAPLHPQKHHNVASTRHRQPYTDKVKASERQKRLEKRLEEDLQSLLSQHNSRVKSNRRACATEEQ